MDGAHFSFLSSSLLLFIRTSLEASILSNSSNIGVALLEPQAMKELITYRGELAEQSAWLSHNYDYETQNDSR